MRRVAQGKDLRDKAEGMELRTWQRVLYQELQDNPEDDRKVIVYVDKQGGAGKSTFIKFMTDKHPHDSLFLENEKAANIKYIVAKHEHPKYIMVNLTRTVAEKVGYQVFESVKDGQFTSGKYDSRNVRIKAPTMIFFTNTHLDYDAMSRDRWDVRELIHNPILKEWETRRYKNVQDPRIDPPPRKRQRTEWSDFYFYTRRYLCI